VPADDAYLLGEAVRHLPDSAPAILMVVSANDARGCPGSTTGSSRILLTIDVACPSGR
jgi:hypothetical protein